MNHLSNQNNAGGFGSTVINPALSQYGNDDTPSLIDFWRLLRVLRKWWWLLALLIVGLPALTSIYLKNITPIYRASSILEVKQEARNIIDASQVENVIVDKEFLTTQVELLRSQSLADDVIRKLNLLSDPYFFNADSEGWKQLTREDKLNTINDVFRGNLNVSPVGRSLLISVSFEHADPRKTAAITNVITTSFIENSMERKFNSTADAREFLEDRLATVKTSLETAERELVEYATEKKIIQTRNDDGQEATGSLDMTELVTLNAELAKARTERLAAQKAYNQASQSSFFVDISNSESINRNKAEKSTLDSEYIEKLATFKPQHPTMLELKARIDLFDEQIKLDTDDIVRGQQEAFKSAYDLALDREKNLLSRVNYLKGSVQDVRVKSIDYNILKREVDTERTQYDGLLQRLKEISVSDDVGSNLVQIVDTAKVPRTPFKPNKLRAMLLSILLSTALGVGLIFLIELIDDRVKNADDVKEKLSQTIMGLIPRAKKQLDIPTALADPTSTIAEAYASLRTNLQFSGVDGGPKVIQITSTRSAEGKSTTALGLSLRLVGLGKKVLLIDADMRRPTFVLPEGHASEGLSGTITSNVNIADQFCETTTDLYLLPSGLSVPNPSEILSSSRFDDIIAHAQSLFDYVVIDSPPVLGLADAPIIGAKVQATLLIVETNALRTPSVRTAIERLRASNTKILGVVLTKYNAPEHGYSDYYQYGSGPKKKSSLFSKIGKSDSQPKPKITV